MKFTFALFTTLISIAQISGLPSAERDIEVRLTFEFPVSFLILDMHRLEVFAALWTQYPC
jgi:hypothetical protein